MTSLIPKNKRLKLNRQKFGISNLRLSQIRSSVDEILNEKTEVDELTDLVQVLRIELKETRELFDPKQIVQDTLGKIPKPKDGKDGKSIVGAKGASGKDGVGIDGEDGVRGDDGEKGKDGKSPTKKELEDAIMVLLNPKIDNIKREMSKVPTKVKKIGGGGGGGGSDSFETITTTKNIAVNTKINLVNATSANITVTLPTAINSARREYHIKKTDSSVNTVTVATAGSETIDDGTTAVIENQYESIRVYSDGSNFHII